MLTVRNQPSDVGQHPHGLAPHEAEVVVSGTGRAARTYRTPVDWTLRDSLKTPTLWLLVVAMVCSFYLWQVMVTQGPLHLQDRGFDPAMAAFFYSLAIGFCVVGGFSPPPLGAHLPPPLLVF